MEEISYLFIDGGYWRQVWLDLFVPVFGAYPIDYRILKTEFQARRIFIYDCLDRREERRGR